MNLRKKFWRNVLLGIGSCALCLLFANLGDFSENNDYFILFSGFALCCWWRYAGEITDCIFEWIKARKSSAATEDHV